MDLALECQADEQQYKTSTEPEMTVHNYTRDNTGLLLVDPYNAFLSEGGELHGHAKPLADEVGTLANLRDTLDAPRKAGIQVYFVPHHRASPSDYRDKIQKVILVGILANTCIESTGRFAAALGYHVTLVRAATAAFSSQAMHDAHEINGPTYAHVILTTATLLAAIR